jgi:hypothetical protein
LKSVPGITSRELPITGTTRLEDHQRAVFDKDKQAHSASLLSNDGPGGQCACF